MNLTVANEFGPNRDPVWFELYQAKKEYGLANLSPASMDDLFNRLLTDDALFQLYAKYLKLFWFLIMMIDQAYIDESIW